MGLNVKAINVLKGSEDYEEVKQVNSGYFFY